MSSHRDPLLVTTSIDKFLEMVRRNYSEQSVTAYTQALQLFVEHLRTVSKVKVAIAAVDDVIMGWSESFLEYLQEHRSVETEHLYSRVLLHYWKFLEVTYGVPTKSDALALYLEVNRRPKSHEIPKIPAPQIAAIVAAATDFQPLRPDDTVTEREYLGNLRDKAFLLTLAHTGLRLSEICDLRKDQFDPSNQQLILSDNFYLSLPPAVARAISTYLSQRSRFDQQNPADLPLFARHDKRASQRVLPISRWTGANIVEHWVNYALDVSIRQKLNSENITITPHSFRHYFVLGILTQTEHDIAATQTLARHGDRSTTRRYLHQINKSTRAGNVRNTGE